MAATLDGRVEATHILCWSCGMYFSAAASSENDQGSMDLASNTASVVSLDRCMATCLRFEEIEADCA